MTTTIEQLTQLMMTTQEEDGTFLKEVISEIKKSRGRPRIHPVKDPSDTVKPRGRPTIFTPEEILERKGHLTVDDITQTLKRKNSQLEHTILQIRKHNNLILFFRFHVP